MKQNLIDIRTLDEGELLASRRRFLKQAAIGSAVFGLGFTNSAQAFSKIYPAHKTLAFDNINTGDKLKLTYFENGHYVRDAIKEINFVMRDYRTGDVHPIDPELLDLLHELRLMIGTNRPVQILSGYRSPATNAKLRKHTRGVAKRSLHMEGKAIDIRIPGIDARTIRNAALKLRQGGVGYYHSSNFVHLDTGNFRTW